MERRNVGRFFFFFAIFCHSSSQRLRVTAAFLLVFFFVFMIMKEEEKKFSFQEVMAPTIETSHERIVFFFSFLVLALSRGL